jgi:predicted RNA-binding protein YlqC (UPF0109 family)
VSVEGEGYVEGDVNVVEDDYADDDVNEIDDYEDGDVNAVIEEDLDDDDEIDAAEGANRSEGGTPTAVLGYLARSLANEPESVVVHTEARKGSVRLRLHVAPEDMGRVIGRRGRTAQAIRTLVGVAGARDGVQTSVDIVDD